MFAFKVLPLLLNVVVLGGIAAAVWRRDSLLVVVATVVDAVSAALEAVTAVLNPYEQYGPWYQGGHSPDVTIVGIDVVTLDTAITAGAAAAPAVATLVLVRAARRAWPFLKNPALPPAASG